MGLLKSTPRKTRRVLIYSHDSFGLGHLRRCRAIAHALVERYKGLSVLILSGSPIIGRFDFRARVDFVRIPGVIKLHNGEYTSLNLHIDITETLAIRASIIRHTADVFRPDVFIVDKEPTGLRGEVLSTLRMLKSRGTRLVLGLRDILDDPKLLATEWRRKNVLPSLRDLYDELWVYGMPQICDPLEGLPLPTKVRRKMVYTGYLRREIPSAEGAPALPETTRNPYLLVTPGGGGDGENMVDWVLRAYEQDPSLPFPALLVLGPFMRNEYQAQFKARAAGTGRVEAITFHNNMEALMAGAQGVVAMGGYNTFCEILSLNKRGLIIPRTVPRLEQHIRASRAASLGLTGMLPEERYPDASVMASALHAMPSQKLPSELDMPGLMDGLPNVTRLIEPWISRADDTPPVRAQR